MKKVFTAFAPIKDQNNPVGFIMENDMKLQNSGLKVGMYGDIWGVKYKGKFPSNKKSEAEICLNEIEQVTKTTGFLIETLETGNSMRESWGE